MSICIEQEQDAVFAEEAFIVDAQLFLYELMESKGMSRAELARAMGVSRARITQIFSDECKNFTMRLFARAVHALGESPRLHCKHFDVRQEAEQHSNISKMILDAPNVYPMWHDKSEMECEPDTVTESVNMNDDRLSALRRKAA